MILLALASDSELGLFPEESLSFCGDLGARLKSLKNNITTNLKRLYFGSCIKPYEYQENIGTYVLLSVNYLSKTFDLTNVILVPREG